jgi:GT2 family glycosyltransferase
VAVPAASVVVVNWNSRVDLAACLASLRAQSEQGHEVIVVDNGSTDGSLELVRRDFPEVRLVDAGENLGFAEGCNRGIALARGDWVAMLNNDAEAEPRWLEELLRAARTGGPRLGMVQSKIVFRERPDLTNSTGVLLFSDGLAEDRGYRAPAAQSEAPGEIFCASAGAALYRRAMLDELRLPTGIFDRTFFMYFEDVDLGWRARLLGWSAVYAPSAVVRHAMHGSASRHGRKFVELQCRRNRVRMVLKNGSPRMVALGLRGIVRDALWAAWLEGPWELARWARAVRDGARQRRAVSDRARVERTAIEGGWIPDRGSTGSA